MSAPTVIQTGAPLESARAAVVLIHGRGATAASMMPLAQELEASDAAFLAPQAPGYAWYPHPFLAPIAQNEPYLSNSLGMLADIFAQLESGGMPAERVLLLGFSQGACLSVEYAARNPRRYGGLAILSGGLIGPPGDSLAHPGSLDGTPVFLGCSNSDPHIPRERVLETEAVLQSMGAQVTTRLYPELGHTVNEEELGLVREMLAGV